jgi:hypothetical protein
MCVLRTSALLPCDRCAAVVARCERGWRAYIRADSTDEPAVEVVCPTCAERLFGEDEVEARRSGWA